jgi:hypothetical protein
MGTMCSVIHNEMKHSNMKQEYMGISGKVSHDPELSKQYNALLQKLGTEGMLILIERWMDDSDLQSIIAYDDNY